MTTRFSPSRGSPSRGSTNSPRDSAHSSPTSSPRTHQSKRNRGTVIVEQSLLSIKKDKNDDPSSRRSTGSIGSDKHQLSSSASVQRKSTGSSISDQQRNSHVSDSPSLTVLSAHSTDSLLAISPPNSNHGSVSSLFNNSTSTPNLSIVTLAEEQILDELTKQIAQGAARLQQLEKRVETIPILTMKVDELERERGKIANDLLDSQAFVDSMKQRLSLLHEQNNQLVKLAHSTGGASAELLRNRNALVASLTQIKKLQERVDSIPVLKAQVRTLQEENTQLKAKEVEVSKLFPDQLPEGVTRASYQELVQENAKLTEKNEKLTNEVKTAGDELNTLTCNLEGLKKRMDSFESTRSIVAPLQTQITRLEQEKAEQYQEYVEVKFHQQSTPDIDTAHLLNEVTSLRKSNSQLHAQLETVTMDARQEKEKLILKLFELESLHMSTTKYELERKLIETGVHYSSPQISGLNHTPKLSRTDSIEDEMADLPPEFKAQVLKLQQLRVHTEQSHGMLQSLATERDVLEAKVEEMSSLIEKKAIQDLKKNIEEKDYKLQVARETISKLEKELALTSVSEQSVLEIRNRELTKEVEQLREIQANYDELVANQAETKQFREEHKSLLRSLKKAKDDKSKAEKRYREGKSRLRSIATELTNSVDLLQKYQNQCMYLQDKLDQSDEEFRRARTMSASYRAKLEMAEVENLSKKAETSLEPPENEAYEKVCKERDNLQATIDSLSKTISQQQEQLWTLKSEKEAETPEKVSEQLGKLTIQLNTAKEHLEREKACATCLKSELDTERSANLILESEHQQLSMQAALLQSELEKSKQNIGDLAAAKLELESTLSSLKESEQKLKASVDVETKKLSEELQSTQDSCLQLKQSLQDKQKALEQESALKQQLEQEMSQVTVQFTRQIDSLNKEVATLTSQHQTKVGELLRSNATTNEELSAKVSLLTTQLEKVMKERTSLATELATLQQSTKESHSLKTKLESMASEKELEYCKALEVKNQELQKLQESVITLGHEVEGYKATILSLQRAVEDAESREIEHERLKQNFKQLEKALGTSSHDNKSLFSILQQTLKELPSYSSAASRSLQDENLRLEEQVNVLSQWNDKQRNEIETLEQVVEKLEDEKVQLLIDIQAKENFSRENAQLKRELKEVEMEVGSLKRQARSELQEEMQVKVATQSQLLAVFNQHNTSLQRQVVDLTTHVHKLGGTLDRDKPVSPPPMPDVSLAIPRGDEGRQRSLEDVESENYILKERIRTMEKELLNLQDLSSQFRRRSSSLRAMLTVPVRPINEELQVSVPPELLLPASLLADYITEHNTTKGDVPENWLESIKVEWFAAMAQRTLTPAATQSYVSTLSRLSTRLLAVVVNLQDEKGNTALHYAIANGNFPVAKQFVTLRCCQIGLTNKAGYTPLMLAAACCVEVGEHKEVMGYILERGNINRTADKDHRTALMLAACSGSLEMVSLFMERGADVNLKDEDGSTALMFACQNGHTDIVSALLSHPSIDLSIKDNEGLTVLDIAREAGFSDLVTLISKYTKSKFKR